MRMSTRDERIQACLDGELLRDELTAAEQRRVDALSEAVSAVAEGIRGVAVPDLTGRVMAALEELDASRGEARTAPAEVGGGRGGLIARAARWLWYPLAVT